MRSALILIVLISISGCSGKQIMPAPSDPTIDDFQKVSETARELGKKFGAGSVLIVYDIDNTLLASAKPLGSDQWFDWQSDDPPDDEEITSDFNCLLRAQGILYHLGSMRLTQSDLSATVAELQADEFPSISLTSRGTEFRLQTHRELRRNDISFDIKRSAVSADDTGNYLPYDPDNVEAFTKEEIASFNLIQSQSRPRYVRFEDGIYFTAGQHKGAMLRLLLARLGVTNTIKAVVFVDDKIEHVNGMNTALSNIRMPVYSYRFSGEDQNVADFRNNVNGQRLEAKSSWCEVSSILNDLSLALGPTNFPNDGKCPDLHKDICATP